MQLSHSKLKESKWPHYWTEGVAVTREVSGNNSSYRKGNKATCWYQVLDKYYSVPCTTGIISNDNHTIPPQHQDTHAQTACQASTLLIHLLACIGCLWLHGSLTMENDVFVDTQSNKPFQHRCSYTVYKELNTDERAARFDKELLEIAIKIIAIYIYWYTNGWYYIIKITTWDHCSIVLEWRNLQ